MNRPYSFSLLFVPLFLPPFTFTFLSCVVALRIGEERTRVNPRARREEREKRERVQMWKKFASLGVILMVLIVARLVVHLLYREDEGKIINIEQTPLSKAESHLFYQV